MNDPHKSVFSSNIYAFFLLALLAYALYLAFLVVQPFVHTLIIAAVLAVIFHPLYVRMLRWCRGMRALAAVLTVGVIALTIFLPLFILAFGMIDQGKQTLVAINAWALKNDVAGLLLPDRIQPYLDWLKERLPFMDWEHLDVQGRLLGFSTSFTQHLVVWGRLLATNVVRLLLLFALLLFALFYFFVDGRVMARRLRYLVPLRHLQQERLIESFKRVSRGVLVGTLFVALLQGVVGGVGFAIAGLPGLFWGAMMAFAALIPVLGTGLIWVPAAGYLTLTGDWEWGLFVALWGLLVVVNIDTFLRPLLLREAARVSTFYIFLAVLGGLYAFGALGLLYGPLILSFAMVMLQIYGEEYKDVLVEPED